MGKSGKLMDLKFESLGVREIQKAREDGEIVVWAAAPGVGKAVYKIIDEIGESFICREISNSIYVPDF